MSPSNDGVSSSLQRAFGGQSSRLDAVVQPGALFASDADGTLWAEDVGEAFLQWLSAERKLVHPDVAGRDAWAEYERRLEHDKYDAYTWAVRCMAGLRETDLQGYCARFVADWVPGRARAQMLSLVGAVNEREGEAWIVSASNRWIVQAAAPLVGISPARALGIEVAVEGGVLVDRIVPPVTFRAGKVEAFQARAGRTPDLAAGDSFGDQELLESARVGLVVAHKGTPPALVADARKRGWVVYVPPTCCVSE